MAKSIMIQGTMSNVGKSFLTAALCRIFKQDGYSCAPFKSQNMALNSYVAADGAEIGRAQAMQAEAAGTEPSALMNPILLKPTADIGSQVIVNGRVMGNMRAAEYFRRKTELIPDIMNAYDELSHRYDIIVIEGAGSPAELNLKRNDIVNMGLAQMVKSPVILAGDIDCGGVFAQLLGTLMLLEPDEREMVKGLVVNRFRGDPALFADGISILEEKGGKPVLGVVPYIDCSIDDEDSLSHKLEKTAADGIIDIAVIRLPRISNFTDFDIFERYEGVSVRYVSSAEMLGQPDMIIIPGTKNTVSDMMHIRANGIEGAVKRCLAEGIPVYGICGGYQIMGGEISDPDGAEGGGSVPGMGILDMKTVFGSEKSTKRVSGRFTADEGFFSCLNGAYFYGYEIHMGTSSGADAPLTDIGGAVAGNAAGCYVHGIFDSAEISGRLVKALYARKGLTYRGMVSDRREYREEQFELLAAEVRKALDMEKIYSIMEAGV